ncbi:MAG: hypothetical protein JST08_00310 [Actinobacteria bacterium]|nr:hypothetical protein [Actinomycetota bacterium]
MLDFGEFRRRHDLGLYLPPTVAVDHQEQAAQLRNIGVYLTYSELTAALGRPHTMTQEEIASRLAGLSAADCMAHLGFIASTLHSSDGPYFRSEVQREVIGHVVGTDSEVGQVLLAAIEEAGQATIFCEQQLIHLARLVALHADDREPDDFGNQALYEDWATCIFGVTDLLDLGLVVESPEERLSWELRQCGVNHHDDRLPSIGLHHEIYRVILPQESREAAARIESAFRSHTGMSLADYFVVGAAVQARFGNNAGAVLDPAEYFRSTLLEPEVWAPFFEILARDRSGLKAELEKEEERYGSTTYGSLSIERFPLFEAQPGMYCVISPWALGRRVTEGVFHLLAEAAEAEGSNRSLYTGEFGIPFQHSVERTLRRGNAATGSPVPVAADVPYGTSRSAMRRSSDVILGYERFPVFVEVVSGPLRVGTLTRGDLEDFEADVGRLVIDKAEQLDTSIGAFLDGRLVIDEIDPATATRIWPVIVTSHAFPLRDEIDRVITKRLTMDGYLQGEKIAPLAILSAEELFFCEGFMERGESFLALISGWKSDPASAPHSFKNYLIEHGGGRAPGAAHFEVRFAEAAAEQAKRIFGRDESVKEVLAQLEEGERS